MKLLYEMKKEGIKIPLLVYNNIIMFASIQKEFKVAYMDLGIIKDNSLKQNLRAYSSLIMGLTGSH